MKSPKSLLSDLSQIKKVSLQDLHSFLIQDHTSFSVLSLSAKHIESTQRLTISLTKNSASSFYLAKPSSKSPTSNNSTQDDCLRDAQNCLYFQFFNSKEKKLYTRFKDKVEANFEGSQAEPLLFITLTFNTTQSNYQGWTTNWDLTDPCWNALHSKQSWLKTWAQSFDPQAEPLKINFQKVSPEVSQYLNANSYLQKFLRQVRLKWKPQRWKWVVVSELQKNGVWHFHLLSTPIVPYSHCCILDKKFTSCWNCRTYISELWPYGRVQSKSPGNQTISSYLAKYLSKSFHLRSLYQEHGLKDKCRAYRFYLNLYEYEEKKVLLQSGSRLEAQTGQPLPPHQKIFRRYDYSTQQTSYFYRTSEKLVGHSLNPILIKKNYRLGIFQPLNLLKLAKTSQQKLNLKKPPRSYSTDFQEFLITRLLLLCDTAQFIHCPLENQKASKELGECSADINHHFTPKPLLRFTFPPQAIPLVLTFLDQLDSLADEFGITKSQDFYYWPSHHDLSHQALRQLGSLCGCETKARNTYLNYWTHFASDYSSAHSPL